MFPCRNLSLTFPESGLNFEGYRFRRQTEALFRIRRPCDVLEREGWIIEKGLKLHERAQISHETWRHRPGFRRVMGESLFTTPASHLETAISLRSRGESNYYHAINDILGSRIRLIEEAGVPKNAPVIVSQALASQPFFKAIRQSAGIVDREVVVQRSGRIRCADLYFAQSATLNIRNILYARDALGVPASDPATSRRVFVVRRPPVPRSLYNAAAVEQILRQHGFMFVEPSHMSMEEQRECFSMAGVVIGVHGAGLLNIMFRRSAPLHLIEILEYKRDSPPPPHYMVLAAGLGFGYTPLKGSALPSRQEGQLVVDIDELRNALERILPQAS